MKNIHVLLSGCMGESMPLKNPLPRGASVYIPVPELNPTRGQDNRKNIIPKI